MAASLRDTVRRLKDTKPFDSEVERAVAIHDFVRDQIRFGFTAGFETVTPEQTLYLRRGHCNAQGDLFRALLGEAGLGAYLRFVQIEKETLYGCVPVPIYLLLPDTLFHAITEVEVNGLQLSTDSYIFDMETFSSQLKKLRHSGRALGFGLHTEATCTWTARENAYSQARSGDISNDAPVFNSLEEATRSVQGNNRLLGIHFNSWLDHIPRPLKVRWESYVNSKLQ